ncbi:MAG: branched-chain amino acid ABC transporter permease [Patescibacteria group bacterium]
MEYLIHLAIIFAIYAILSLSLNLVVGYTGMISITHAAFFGIGAYATAILTTEFGFDFFLSALLGVTITAPLAFFIGLVFNRLSGDYYVLGTVGFNAILVSIFLNWQNLTRGALGIPGIPRPEVLSFSLSSNFSFLISSALFLIITFLVSRFISKSSFGRALKAIREDEKAIQVFGFNTPLYKTFVFVIAASIASLAGSLLASYLSFIDPSNFTVLESVFIFSIVILGGAASLRGSLLGALILVLLPELLRFVGFPTEIAAQARQAIYGLILILLMLYRPQGLIGEYKL